MAIHLVRHGRPASDWGGADADPGLDSKGLEQARAVAERLLSAPEADRPRRVVSSPLRRCRETAAPLAEAIGVALVIDPAVGEIPTPSTIPIETRGAWLRNAFLGTWAAIDGDIDYEDWRQGVARAVSAWDHTAVFSHFVAINAVTSKIMNDPRVIVFRPDHTSVSTLDRDSAGALTIRRLGAEAETSVL